MSFNPVFGGNAIYPDQPTFLSLVMSTSQTLAWPIEQQIGGNVAAAIIELNASVESLSVSFADARMVGTGYTTLFNNVGSNTVTILDSTGATLATVASGEAWEVYLRDNTTAAGLWRVLQYGAGTSTADAAGLAGAGLIAISSTLNEQIPVSQKSTNYVVLSTDRAVALEWIGGTGTFTTPNPAAGGIGVGWYMLFKNEGTGTLTLAPAGGTIDGLGSKTVTPGNSGFLISDGTNMFTVGYGQAVASAFDFALINVAGGADHVLTLAEQNRIAYELTGVLTANINIIVPNTIQQYWVNNQTTGAFTVTVKTAAGTGVVVPQGQRTILYSDGINVVNAETLAVSTPVGVNQGGTGIVVGVSGGILAFNSPTGIVSSALLVANALVLGGGAGAAPSTPVGLGTTTTVLHGNAAGAPAFSAVDLTTDITGVLPIASGGTGMTSAAGSLAALGGVPTTRIVNAGAGLTGGGDLSADRTFDVGAGPGITVNANDVAINQAFAPDWTDTHTFSPALSAIIISGANSSYGEQIRGGAAVGQSLGLTIAAGTNAADRALNITDQTGGTPFLGVFGDGGTVLGSATGGDKGLGTINAQGVFINGVALTGTGGLKLAAGSVIGNALQVGSAGVTSVTHTGTGVYTIDYTAAGFVNPPGCTATKQNNNFNYIYDYTGVTNTSAVLHVTAVGGGSPVDDDFGFICAGI
jgi:hypothetical protein